MHKYLKVNLTRTIFLICLSTALWEIASSANAQQNMEHLLNNVDSPSSWAKTPVSVPSGTPPVQYTPNIVNPNTPLLQENTQGSSTQLMRMQMLRTLFGGSGASANSGSNTDWSSSNAYSDWQEAENQASRAHNAEERARYDKDKWRRGDDASEAYYAAKSARNASDRVYNASRAGDPTGKQYAGRARAAADRAQADSDQARYYADSNN